MIEFFVQNGGTILLSLLLISIVIFDVRKLCRKNGNCGCNCKDCRYNGCCYKNNI